MTEREKMIEIVLDTEITGIKLRNITGGISTANAIADALIEAGIGDVKEAEHRAELAEAFHNLKCKDYDLLNYQFEKMKHRAKVAEKECDDSKIEYRGYQTYIHYSAADKVLYGKIEGIKDLVNFESHSVTKIEKEFHKAVDDYIEFCREVGKNIDEVKE